VRDPRMDSVLRAVQARYPGKRVAVERYESPDDPLIRWWIYVLDVPEDELGPVGLDLVGVARREYGRRPVPFFIGPADPERTEELLAGKYGPPPRIVPRDHRSRRSPSPRRSTSPRRARRGR